MSEQLTEIDVFYAKQISDVEMVVEDWRSRAHDLWLDAEEKRRELLRIRTQVLAPCFVQRKSVMRELERMRLVEEMNRDYDSADAAA